MPTGEIPHVWKPLTTSRAVAQQHTAVAHQKTGDDFASLSYARSRCVHLKTLADRLAGEMPEASQSPVGGHSRTLAQRAETVIGLRPRVIPRRIAVARRIDWPAASMCSKQAALRSEWMALFERKFVD
jgi:hypothetical protein